MTPPNSPEARRGRNLIHAFSRLLGPRVPRDGLPAAGITPLRPSLRSRRGLHVCGECGTDAVNPAHAEPLDDERWSMLLRCGACGATVRRIVSNEEAERYDRELDRGYSAIARALDRSEREQMVEWADAFSAALERDLFDADDFCPR